MVHTNVLGAFFEKKIALFLSLLIISLIQGKIFADPLADCHAADQAYGRNAWPEAISGYERTLHGGYLNGQMLYRMAFCYEKTGNLPMSVFCLRKAQQLYGEPLTSLKVQQLIEQMHGITRIPPPQPPVFRIGLRRAYPFLLGAMVLLLLAMGWVLRKRFRHFPILMSGGAVVVCAIGGLLLWYDLGKPHQAVVVQATPCYESPSYVLLKKQDPPLTGAVIEIESSQDIWLSTGKGRFQYWIPQKSVREL